jgi:hypothetical protein
MFTGADHSYAEVILDSVSHNGDRLTTMVVRFPRFVLAEFNTHRVFSRNSASSRAIPVTKRMATLEESTFAPFIWTSEQPGMQGGEPLTGEALGDAETFWEEAFNMMFDHVSNYNDHHPEKSERLHKSLVNRLLEPFMWHTVVVSATEWENFFSQRCSPLAQPEIMVAAELMRDALNGSTPIFVSENNIDFMHTPFIQPDELDLDLYTKIKISVARGARVSFMNHDGVRDIEADISLFNKLVHATPPHYSPLEHVATPVDTYTAGNFDGWAQLRHIPEIINSLRSNDE